MRLLALALLACSTRHYIGPRVTTEVGTMAVDGERVLVAYQEQHANEYEQKCAFGLFGDEAGGCDQNPIEVERVDPLGAIVVDLRTGECSFDPAARVTRSAPPRRVLFGDSTFAADRAGVRETRPDGRELVHHGPHPMAGITRWFEPRPWPVGAERHGVRLAERDGELWLIRDTAVLGLGRAGAVYTFDDEAFAVARDAMIDLARWRRLEVRGLPRLGRIASNLAVEVPGAYYSTDRNGELQPLPLRQELIGTDGKVLVFEHELHTLAMFDLASRRWRVVPYGGCKPR